MRACICANLSEVYGLEIALTLQNAIGSNTNIHSSAENGAKPVWRRTRSEPAL
jgi:hypothetical protein